MKLASMAVLLRAAWVHPVTSPILCDGAVLLDGPRIAAVAPFAELSGRGELIDLGETLLLPGLVNAHVHLELSDVERPPLPAGGFIEWIAAIRARNRTNEAELPARMAKAIAIGAAQCLKSGATCVGDISRNCQLTRPVLARSPLRGVSFGEVIALGKLRGQRDDAIIRALDGRGIGERLRIGITPHAPYTVEPEAYRWCMTYAVVGKRPIATHLAETPFEEPFLRQHAGPFRELWERIGEWDEAVPRFDGTPVQFAKALFLLDHRALLAHVNYCDDADLDLLARGNASVVYCPRTHAYFQHPPHRWREMLGRGINVAIGTDSCASSGDLDLLADLRLVHQLAPDMPPDELLRLVTINGARALKMEDEVGSLEPGKRADLAAFRVAGADPLRAMTQTSVAAAGVWVDGQPVGPASRA